MTHFRETEHSGTNEGNGSFPSETVLAPASHDRRLATCIFSHERAKKPIRNNHVSWSKVVAVHSLRDVRPSKSGHMLGGYLLEGGRCNDNVASRSLIQLDIDSEGRKDKETGRILEVTRRAPDLEDIRSPIDCYEWVAASSHWHEPRRGVVKYRVVIFPDRDILQAEHEPVLLALDELLGGMPGSKCVAMGAGLLLAILYEGKRGRRVRRAQSGIGAAYRRIRAARPGNRGSRRPACQRGWQATSGNV